MLDHFNLKINAGEKIALVGVNGAGKTTVVKLLCGFYKPDSGIILIGGQDINNFRKKDLLKLYAAVFQDIYIPPFTAAENVSMQELKTTDRNRVCLLYTSLPQQQIRSIAGAAFSRKGIAQLLNLHIRQASVLEFHQDIRD